jgi:WD40 repeat protein
VKTGFYRTLVAGSRQCGYYQPRFIEPGTVAFTDGWYVTEVDTVTGATHAVPTNLGIGAQVFDFSISLKGGMIAALGGWGGNSLNLTVSSLGGRKLFSKRLGFLCACDGILTPLEVKWSPDASLLLVGVTSEDGFGRVYVFDRKGHQVRPAIKGDTPQWIGSRSFLLETWNNSAHTWTKMDVTGHSQRVFETTDFLTLPRFSPDGTKIAFSDDANARFEIYDLSTKKLRAYGPRESWPLWMSNVSVAESVVTRCNCEGTGYEATGIVDLMNFNSGSIDRMGISQIADADVLF